MEGFILAIGWLRNMYHSFRQQIIRRKEKAVYPFAYIWTQLSWLGKSRSNLLVQQNLSLEESDENITLVEGEEGLEAHDLL
jgi:hypothetical protein